MNNGAQRQYDILERILDGDPMPQPDYSEALGTPRRKAMEDFADFTRFVEGQGKWDERYRQFLPKEG